MSKIRIVHVLYSFGIGGLEKGIATLVRHASEDMEHIIVCLKNSGPSIRLLPPDTSVIECGKLEGNSFRFICSLATTINSLRPNLVHTRNWTGVDGIIASVLGRIKTIVHGEHGWGMEDPQGRLSKRVVVRKFLSLFVTEFTCVSKDIETWLKHRIRVKKKITQIYNGVDTERYSPGYGNARIRAELSIPEKAFLMGVVGRLDPIKNHRMLFGALEIVREHFPDSYLAVVGDGPERGQLEAAAGSGVMFLGNRSDVPELLKAFDIFVLGSVNEGTSNTILEAMAAGLPVVATRVGGNPELVLDGITGFLLESGDFQGMASAISRYVKNPELQINHGRAGRHRVVDNFSIQKMVQSYEAVYRRAIGETWYGEGTSLNK